MAVTHRACNLCEAICGLEIEHDGTHVTSIRGDKLDPFSRGHICPKAVALKDLHEDPDRLRLPQRRDGDTWTEVTWDEAFADIGRRLREIRRAHGKDALAFIQGNPVVHNYGSMFYAQIFLPMILGTRNRFSSTSVDNLPRMLVSKAMYGSQTILPVPDIDRVDYLLVLGANPAVSNGSVMTAPDLPKRLRAIRERGGMIVLIDPRRNETAELATRHHFIKPGRDALFLLALLHTIFGEGRERIRNPVRGLAEVRSLVAGHEFSPDVVAPKIGISADDIVRIARELCAAERAIVYGRMGISAQEFGALATWLHDVINVVTGNLDRAGGMMFTRPAVDLVAVAKLIKMTGTFDGFRSRVRGLPEFNGELPMATLAEEIEAGGIKAALLTACNPVLSAPNGPRIERALSSLDLVIAVDFYRNESTRLAHYILPPTTALEHEHYDLALYQLSIRNAARWNPPVFAPATGALHDWQIFVRLIAELGGGIWARAVNAIGDALTPERLTDWLLRFGPRGLSVAQLAESPHGVDLGPLDERLAEIIQTPDRTIDLAPALLVKDIDRLRKHTDGDSLVLIGRREVRTNNSWMHNSARLVKGPARCTLQIHPQDAAARAIVDGQRTTVKSKRGEVELVCEVTDAVMLGVVSIPHGWGHNRGSRGAQLRVADAHQGVSVNDLTDEELIDRLCGTAALNGVAVEVAAARS